MADKSIENKCIDEVQEGTSNCELVAFYKDRVEYLELLVRRYKFDFLTGLMGKRDYTNRIDSLFEDYKFSNTEFYFGLIDINDLHNTNRRKGYHEGDNMIKNVASKMESFFPFHSIFRIGGDEFAILIRGHDTTLEEINNKLQAIENITFAVESSHGYDSPKHMHRTLDSKLSAKKKSEIRL